MFAYILIAILVLLLTYSTIRMHIICQSMNKLLADFEAMKAEFYGNE